VVDVSCESICGPPLFAVLFCKVEFANGVAVECNDRKFSPPHGHERSKMEAGFGEADLRIIRLGRVR
jgi:hypothetical protein